MQPKIRLDTPEDTPRIVEAIYEICLWDNQGNRDEADAREVQDGFAYYYENFPEYTSGRIALAEVDGEIASLAGIIPFPVRKGDFSIKAAQLNPVGTRRECRHQGLASACIRLLCDHLKRQGYSIFFVCGVPWFYPRLGFNPAFDEYTATVPTDRLKDISPPARVRPFRMEDAAQFLAIYEGAPDQNLLHLRRDRRWIDKKILKRQILPLGTIHGEDILLSTQEDRGGYVALDKGGDLLSIKEIRAWSRGGLLSLLHAAAEIGISQNVAEIEIRHAVPGETLHSLILDLGGRVTLTHPRHLMLKILSVSGLFASLREVFQDRIAPSAWAEKSFSVTIESHGEKVTLAGSGGAGPSIHVARGKSKTLKVPDPALVRLFTGHRTINELIDTGVCPDFGKEDNSLLHALFPRHYPYIYKADGN